MYEISSDSDDDCYGNIPQKLQKLKNKHAYNNLVKVFENSLDDKDFDTYGVGIINRDSDVIPVLDSNVDLTNVSSIQPSPSKERSTRSRRNKRTNSDVEFSPVTQKSGKRGKRKCRGSQTSVSASAPRCRGRSRRGREDENVIDETLLPSEVTAPPRQGRTQRLSRQRTSRYPTRSSSIITYSIGNTDEYPDASENQVLFSNKNKPPEAIPVIDLKKSVDIDTLDDSLTNEELSVKVHWQHSEVVKFNIRRLQKLTQIFDFFTVKAGVTKDRLLFTYENNKANKILYPDDTPESIDYNIAKFIEGGIVNKQFCINHSDSPQKTGFIVKFQCQDKKKPLELAVGRDEKLQLALVRCAEHLEMPIGQLVFEFDGELIQGNSTPNNLDMESGDCIDVKIINVNK